MGGAAPAASAPRCAAPSMPAARPDTTATPAAARSRPSSNATPRPVAEQRRVPTIATRGPASRRRGRPGGTGPPAARRRPRARSGYPGDPRHVTCTPSSPVRRHSRRDVDLARRGAATPPTRLGAHAGRGPGPRRRRATAAPAQSRRHASAGGTAARIAVRRAGPIRRSPAIAAAYASGGRASSAASAPAPSERGVGHAARPSRKVGSARSASAALTCSTASGPSCARQVGDRAGHPAHPAEPAAGQPPRAQRALDEPRRGRSSGATSSRRQAGSWALPATPRSAARARTAATRAATAAVGSPAPRRQQLGHVGPADLDPQVEAVEQRARQAPGVAGPRRRRAPAPARHACPRRTGTGSWRPPAGPGRERRPWPSPGPPG